MMNYTYQIVRYMPDRISEEFVNVGLVLFCKEKRYLKAETIDKLARVKHLFPFMDSRAFNKKLKGISNIINNYGEEWSNHESLNSFILSLFPKDDSSIIFSETLTGIDLSLDNAFDDLFERFVCQHNTEVKKHLTDKDVWREYYKQYFEKYKFNKAIQPRVVQTEGDELKFEYAVKNGKWNFLEPVTFDLIDNKVKEKVYKWIGKLEELDTSGESFKLYLLTKLPDNVELKQFIRTRITKVRSDNFVVSIVEPEGAERLAAQLRLEMENL